ncbi:MAG TPA: hypothetical protein VMU16_02185 [Candidatus Binataceae bacterium]|nr:hypothetical protein [Candidatus Binataceae bacterium]
MKPSKMILSMLLAVMIFAIGGLSVAYAAGHGGGGHSGGHASAGHARAHAAVHGGAARRSRMASNRQNSRWHRNQQNPSDYRYRRDYGYGWWPGGYWGGSSIVDEDADHDQWQSLYEDSHSPYLKSTEGNPAGKSHTWEIRSYDDPGPEPAAPAKSQPPSH